MAKRKRKPAKPDLAQKEASVPQTRGPDSVRPVPASGNRGEYVVREWEFFSGPLPPPDVFAQYKAIDPEIVRVILDLAEREQKHRQDIENKLTDADIRSHFRGQSFAALISVLLILSLTFLFWTDHTWEAAGLGAGGFVSIIFAFLRNRFIESPIEQKETKSRNGDRTNGEVKALDQKEGK